MYNSITVRDYMPRHLLTFHAETGLFTAIDLLRALKKLAQHQHNAR